MHYASIENLSKAYGVRTLFQHITLHIEQGDKIALVARNGSGKTTLLKIIAGLETADEGTVWIHKDVRPIMLQQETPFDAEKSIWENVLTMDHPVAQTVRTYERLLQDPSGDPDQLTAIMAEMDTQQAWTFETKLKQILGVLQIHDLDKKIGLLSGGQKKRVALAQALVEAALYEGRCLLILDEPTNHLDVSMIEWLEDYLSTGNTTLLLVTHDRYFLDAICNEIIEIDHEQVHVYKGNYDTFLEQKAHRAEVTQSERAKDINIYRRELEWVRKQPKARTTKSKSREEAFDKLEQKLKERKENQDVSLQVKMARLGGKVLELKKVYKQYGNQIILKGFDYTFKKGERIGVVGKNGVGKSTFLRIALQQEQPDSGKINHGDTVVFGHFSQEGLIWKEDVRAIEFVKSLAEFFPLADGSKLAASQFMEKFGFNSEQQFTPLSKLSGGEKRRLHLLSVLFRNPNFLVLDEPTNDLDLQTLRTLEEFLLDYPGCILIVSHDRYFMDRLVDHLFVMEGDGIVRDFPGNYTQYRLSESQVRKKNQEERNHPATPEAKQEETSMRSPKTERLSFKEKFEKEQIEKELPLLIAEKKRLETLLETETAYAALEKTANRISELIQSIDRLEFRWLELSEKSE